jgi:DNA-binding response OmpR family regulator
MIVEDDLRLAEMIEEFFDGEGFDVSKLHRGDDAIKRISEEQPDLVILDISLPGANGFNVCRAVRKKFDGLILMLTARDDDIDQIVGLEIGADDYVVKPVDPRVLLARVRSLLRRCGSTDSFRELQFGSLRIDSTARVVSLDEEIIDLTTAEFDLLWILASSAGSVIDRDSLFKRLRGLDYDGLDRSMDVTISRLRKKLGDDGESSKQIKTVRGKGYLFAAKGW